MATVSSALVAKCSCGAASRVPVSFAGRKVRCRECGEAVRVPGEKQPRERPTTPSEPRVKARVEPRVERPVAPRVETRVETPSAPRGFVRIYWLLALAFLPLAIITFQDTKKAHDDLVKRFEHTIASASPDTARRVEGLMKGHATFDQVLAAIPENRIEGAYLPRSTNTHWVWAAASAIFFLIALPLLFPWASSHDSGLLLVSIFTGTFGVLFLFVLQFFCSSAYDAALDPDASIFSSMFGFTMGVGLAEELAKALPLVIFFVSGRRMGWRRACLWGFASGIGFGVSEGIQYSGDMYNGIFGRDIYLVRFVSCVALHAIWAASSAIVLGERQEELKKAKTFDAMRATLLRALAAPMIFHGFYDTLLKHDENLLALLTAVASFWWFASEIERLGATESQGFHCARPVPA